MCTPRSPRTHHIAAALLASALVLGCSTPEPGANRSSDASTTENHTAAGPPSDPTPAPAIPLAAGDPWSKAEEYLGTLEFVGDTATHIQVANVCEDPWGCPAQLRISPEHRARYLAPSDFQASQRVIAAFELDQDARVPPLGFNPGVRGARSWLLTTGPATAVVMYESGGRIAFTGAWRFATEVNATEAGKQKARWIDREHTHGGPLPDSAFTHLQSAWVSCAEGCCNATSLQ